MVQVLREDGGEAASRWAAIQALVPAGLLLAEEEMGREARKLSGRRYARGKVNGPWGANPGYIYLGDQMVSTLVPRVRNRRTSEEVPLASYKGFQNPRLLDHLVLQRVLQGLSQGRYEEVALQTPITFGIKKSSVSKRFIKASGKKLRQFLERDLSPYDIVALVLDGKTYAQTQIVVALGVTLEGEKLLLGFTEASTENYQICKDFLHRLMNRGLRTEKDMLVVLDGAKGLRKGVQEVLGEKAFIQRCQWHKRENVLRYLDRGQQEYFRRKLQAAYEAPTYEGAKGRLLAVKRELKALNECAVASLEEGLEETLTLHRLGMFTKVGISFKTTNSLENVNKHLQRYTGRVDRWRSSDQKHRWIASALIDIEPRLRQVKGKEFLPTLRDMMRVHRDKQQMLSTRKAA